MLSFKLLIVFAVLLVTTYLAAAVFAGRRVASHPAGTSDSDAERNTDHHVSHVLGVMCSTFVLVGLILLYLHTSDDTSGSSPTWLVYIHRSLVGLYLACFVTILILNGKRNPWWHRRLAYSLSGLFVAVATTGGWMLYHLPG